MKKFEAIFNSLLLLKTLEGSVDRYEEWRDVLTIGLNAKIQGALAND